MPQFPQGAILSRRKAFWTAGAVLSSTWIKPASAAAQSARIAIIGAGLAGLTAAMHLHDHGFFPQIYEANDRVGGRVYSRRSGWLNQQTSEWGAELIDTSHHMMHQLVRRFGLTLENRLADEQATTQMTYYFHGQYYSQAEIMAEFRAIYPYMQEQMQKVGEVYDAFVSLEKPESSFNMQVGMLRKNLIREMVFRTNQIGKV